MRTSIQASHLLVAAVLATATAATVSAAPNPNAAAAAVGKRPTKAATVDRATFIKTIAGWPAQPRLAARMTMVSYGLPTEISSGQAIWRDVGSFARITVYRDQLQHDFPVPHMDFIEHTIAMNVPLDKVDDLLGFDGSLTINRTAGELSARCDLEAHNLIALNLAADIINNKKTVPEARVALGQLATEDMLGKRPSYAAALQVAAAQDTAFVDHPTVNGIGQRQGMGPKGADTGPDAETLALMLAVDQHELTVAKLAMQKQVSQPVLGFATMMVEDHGKHFGDTVQLDQAIKIAPVETAQIERMKADGAEGLAKLVTLDGKPFEIAYMDAMIKGHTEVLGKLDKALAFTGGNAELRKHTQQTRDTVAHHLEMAKKVRAKL